MKSAVVALFLISLLCQGIFPQTVTDYDGNVYPTVTIGNQTWMAENMQTTHYPDGKPLVYGGGLGKLERLDTTKYYFYYDDNPSYADDYGCLYTWFAAMGKPTGYNEQTGNIQGICPDGWHIPNDADWQEMEVFLGMDSSIAYSSRCVFEERPGNFGNMLKVGGSTGFNAKYAGVRDENTSDSYYFGLGMHAEFITSLAYGASSDNNMIDVETRLYYVLNNFSELLCHYHVTNAGYSVRCIKDEGTSVILNHPEKHFRFTIYPNLLNYSTTFYFTLQKAEHISLKIFNLTGQHVVTLVNEIRSAGGHQVQWQADGLPSGIYYAKLQCGKSIETQKLIIQQ